MPFITRINFQDNRQHFHPERETHQLSGDTCFGVPFSALTTGPDPSDSGTTGSIINVVSTFSGNTGTTVFTFGDSRMDIAQGSFSALTDATSAITQDSGNVWVGNTSQVVDGNLSYLDYTGTSFEIEVTAITETAPGIFTGTVVSDDVFFLSAGTLDFTGRTIWVDVKGITKTQKLCVTDGAVAGYVLTAQNSDGDLEYTPITAITSGDTFITGASFDAPSGLLRHTRNDGANIDVNLSALTDTTFWEETGTGNTALKDKKGTTHAIAGISDYSILAGGNNNDITSSTRSSIIGGVSNSIDGGSGSLIAGASSSDIISGNTSIIVGGNGHNIQARGAGATVDSGGIIGGATNDIIDSFQDSDRSFIIGGVNNNINDSKDSLIFGSSLSNITNSTSGSNDTLAFIIGGSSHLADSAQYSGILAGSGNVLNDVDRTVILGGTGITATTDDTVYVPYLNIGNVGSGTSIINLGLDVNGFVVTGTTGSGATSATTFWEAAAGIDSFKAIYGSNISISTNYSMAGVGNDHVMTGSGYFNVILGGDKHTMNGVSGFLNRNAIIGGSGHTMSNRINDSFIGGGENINVSDRWTGVIGGKNLTNSSRYGFMGGGLNNTNTGDKSFVSAGQYNKSTNNETTVVGGQNNWITGGTSTQSSIIGGQDNEIISSIQSSILGGRGNTLSASTRSTIGNGYNNYINNSPSSAIGAGFSNGMIKNSAGDPAGYNFIGSGFQNRMYEETKYSIIGAGIQNTMTDSKYSMIGAGNNNSIGDVLNVAILAGANNVITSAATNSSILAGSSVTADTPNSAYFLSGVTDWLSGYTNHNNFIDMTHGGNNTIKISHTDSFGQERYLSFDESTFVRLERNTSNYLRLSSGVGQLQASSQAQLRNSVGILEVSNSYGLHYTVQNGIGSNGNMVTLRSQRFGGSVGATNILDGGMQGEIHFGIPKSGTFSAGTFGSGAGVSATGTSTGYEYHPVFISSPRGLAHDNIDYDSIYNGAFVGGSDHTTYTGVTDFAFIGGTGNTITSGTNRTVIIGGQNITGNTDDMVYVPDLVIDGLTSTDPIATDANGKIVAGTSDRRLKQNIKPLSGGLDKIKQLQGVSFEYTEESNMGGGTRYGFIAQDVQEVIPDMVRARAKGDGMLNLNYDEVIPWLVEAVKDISSGDVTFNNTIIETQTLAAEDNFIELNYGGSHDSAAGGGITVKDGIREGADSFIKIDENGRWVIGPALTTSQLTLPEYTPDSSTDDIGSSGDVVWDDRYLYIKTNFGWRRTGLESF